MTTKETQALRADKAPKPTRERRVTYHLRMLPEIQNRAAEQARMEGRSLGAYFEHLVRKELGGM